MKIRNLLPSLALIVLACTTTNTSNDALFDGASLSGWSSSGDPSLQLETKPDETGNPALRVTGSGAELVAVSLRLDGGAGNTTGIRFRLRSTGSVIFSVTTPALVPTERGGSCTSGCGDFHQTELPASSEWVTVTLTWNQLVQASGNSTVALDLSTITFLNWRIQSVGPYELWLDDIEFVSDIEQNPDPITSSGGAPGAGGSEPIATGGAPVASGGSPNNSTNNLGKHVDSIMFLNAFPNRNAAYSYSRLLEAVALFPDFAACCSETAAKREIAAFFAHVTHETGGLRYTDEINQPASYCNPDSTHLGVTIGCPAGGNYWGRGAMQTSWNYNYYFAQLYFSAHGHGEYSLHTNPNLVTSDPVLIWATALWFWMAGDPTFSESDTPHNRLTNSGFGATTQKINGGLECGANPTNPNGSPSRIQYYQEWCTRLGVDPGSNLGC